MVSHGNPLSIDSRTRSASVSTGSMTIFAMESEYQLPDSIAKIVIDPVETEADLVRLSIDRGFPWETIPAELRNYRITHENASTTHWMFKVLSLIPACFMTSHLYYSLRQHFAQNGIYRKAREKWLPFLKPAHVDRYRTTRP